MAGGPAQLLIRNPAALAPPAKADAGDVRIGALVALMRAAARRAPLAGYAVESGDGRFVAGIGVLELWRGARFEALVLALGPGDAGTDAPALAARLGPRIAAVWTAPPGTDGARLAVAVRERAPHPGTAPGTAGGGR